MFAKLSDSKTFNKMFQLLLMKRGGEEIYVGPLGHHSCDLIKYFEVCDDDNLQWNNAF